MDLLLFCVGLVALVAGAELLVRGAGRLARAFGVSPLVVGLTVVSFGTSAPELAVSVGSAMSGAADLAAGSIVGSNIFNILAILGLSALIAPLAVDAQVVRQEVPVMIGASLLLTVFALDGVVGGFEGLVLVVLLAGYTSFLVKQARRQTRRQRGADSGASVAHTGDADPDRTRPALTLPADALRIAAGLTLLVLGSGWLVDGAAAIARALGVSDVVIGLTVVAAGTSMPELATSLLAALRGERDIAVGNVVGSNVFNVLGGMGAAAAVAPGGVTVPASVLAFDLWVALAAAVACLPVVLTGHRIARWEGALLVGYYVVYVVWLVLAALQHTALPTLRTAVLWFVLPLTAATLVLSVWRSRGARGRTG